MCNVYVHLKICICICISICICICMYVYIYIYIYISLVMQRRPSSKPEARLFTDQVARQYKGPQKLEWAFKIEGFLNKNGTGSGGKCSI